MCDKKVEATPQKWDAKKVASSGLSPQTQSWLQRSLRKGGRHGHTIIGKVNAREEGQRNGMAPNNYWAKAVRIEYEHMEGVSG